MLKTHFFYYLINDHKTMSELAAKGETFPTGKFRLKFKIYSDEVEGITKGIGKYVAQERETGRTQRKRIVCFF